MHTLPHFLGSWLHVTLSVRNGGEENLALEPAFSRSTVFWMQRAQRPHLEKYGTEEAWRPGEGQEVGTARKCQAPGAGPASRQGGCGTDAGPPGGVRQDCAVGEGDVNVGLEALPGGGAGWRAGSKQGPRAPSWPTAGPAPTGELSPTTSTSLLPRPGSAHRSEIAGGARGPPQGLGRAARTAAQAGFPARSVLHSPRRGCLSVRPL